MGFVFTIAGLIAVITGIKGTYAEFGKQVAGDFTGSRPFTYWVVAIIAVGMLGYIDALRTISRMFLALILIVMIISNRGFFAQLTDALKQGPIAPAGGTGAPASNVATSSGASGSSTLGAFGQSPGDPGAVGTSGQSKFNQYMNSIWKLFSGG